jgi:ligand-binding sensor domain-containing protein
MFLGILSAIIEFVAILLRAPHPGLHRMWLVFLWVVGLAVPAAGRLLRYNGERFEFVPSPPGSPKSRYWNLWPEDHDALWIGTYAGGLWQYQAGAFKQVLASFPDFNRITGGLTDDEGNLWLGTRKGIEWVARAALTNGGAGVFQPLQHRVYGRGDGLRSIGTSVEFQPRCWKGQDGRLWFATPDGVASVTGMRGGFTMPASQPTRTTSRITAILLKWATRTCCMTGIPRT